jgi:hypothetical protein
MLWVGMATSRLRRGEAMAPGGLALPVRMAAGFRPLHPPKAGSRT